MDFSWTLFVDLGIISFAMLLATLIRSRVPFFQRFLIPNALTAGFILLPFYNFVAPLLGLGTDGLGEMIYHLLSISFVAMTLRKSPRAGKKGDRGIISFSVGVLSQYGLQAFIGLLLTIIFISTFAPTLFPAFGFLCPLGFALGPGQAFAIGKGWEALGFNGAGTVGLTFAAVGFLWACFGGMFLINYGIRRGWMSKEQAEALNKRGIRRGVYKRESTLPSAGSLTTESEAIDSMTFNTGVVLAVYFLSYLFLHLVTYLLSFAGDMGRELAVNLWGISFVFAALVAIVIKQIFKITKLEYVLDNGTLTRISGLSVDLMVTSAVAAISLVIVAEYWLPILLLSVVVGPLILITVPWFCSRLFRDHQFHRMLMIYGVSTGTLPTGLALLRVIDPDFETPVASDYMYSAGLTFILAIPFILAINLPAYASTQNNMPLFWLAVLVSFVYMVVMFIAFLVLSKGRAFKKASTIWLRQDKS